LIGMFGVVSYAVAQRAHEIGIRIAIGADRRSITSLMARQSMVPAAIGLLAGVLASVALSRFLASFLYEVTPTDVPTQAVAAVLLALSGWVASYIPARRAARIDPLATMRR